MLVDLSVIFDQETGDYIAMLLERAKPMKVIMNGKNLFPSLPECKCGYPVMSVDNYCPDCGQALDWSE